MTLEILDKTELSPHARKTVTWRGTPMSLSSGEHLLCMWPTGVIKTWDTIFLLKNWIVLLCQRSRVQVFATSPGLHANAALAPFRTVSCLTDTLESIARCRKKHDCTDNNNKMKSCFAILSGFCASSYRRARVTSVLRAPIMVA